MIKRLALFFNMLLICTITLGCSSQDIEVVAPKQPQNEYENLVISDIKYNETERILHFKAENTGDSILTTGVGYTIEKFDSAHGWTKTNLTDNLAFIQIALLITQYEKIAMVIDFSQIEPLEDGFYRITKQYIDDKNTILGYIQFESKSNNLMNFDYYNTIKQ